MRTRFIFNTFFLNVVTAILIGFITVFPDIIINYENKQKTDFPKNEFVDKNKFDFQENYRREKLRPDFLPPHKNEVPIRYDISINPVINILIEFVFFSLLSWMLLSLNNPKEKDNKITFILFSKKYHSFINIFITLIVTYLSIFAYTRLFMKGSPDMRFSGLIINGIYLFKGLFVSLLVILFGRLFFLMNKQHNMKIEYEQMKSENLESKLEALSAQISPHFFFNSLNSLSGLIRDKQHKKALKYIGELSNLFRYILNGNRMVLTYLRDESEFLDIYMYLSKIKYGKKMVFEINIDKNSADKFMLPAFSVQPVVENITKHNIISKEFPMHIKIYITDTKTLIIENDYHPKPEYYEGTGIGLTNLNKRYKYLTGNQIKNYISNGKFIVELPLQMSEKE